MRRYLTPTALTLALLVPALASAGVPGQPATTGAPPPPASVCPTRPRIDIVYTSRLPARVEAKVESWGQRQEDYPIIHDPTRATLSRLPRGSTVQLFVQQPSLPLNLAPGTGDRRARFGQLRRELKNAYQLRQVWQAENVQPDVNSEEVSRTWTMEREVLPVNQPWVAKWQPLSAACGLEERRLHGHVQGTRTQHEWQGRTLITRGGELAPLYDGFIQRQNLLKTDAYTVDGNTLVKVKAVRALPAGASYEIRNLTTGARVTGTASRYGSFNARVPVLPDAEQYLELAVTLTDQNGRKTELRSTLGKVSFAEQCKGCGAIDYKYVDAAGRSAPGLSANVKGHAVMPTSLKRLAAPEVKPEHALSTGIPERGTMFNFHSSKMGTRLTLAHVPADSIIEVYQQGSVTPSYYGRRRDGEQVPVPEAGWKPTWMPVKTVTVTSAPNDAQGRSVVLDSGIVSFTPLKIVVKRPDEAQPHTILTNMPDIGQPPTGNFTGEVQRIHRYKDLGWVRPEGLKRSPAFRDAQGISTVSLEGKWVAPASARAEVINETTGARALLGERTEEFHATLPAEPGHRLALQVTLPSGETTVRRLGIVPNSVAPTYRPSQIDHFPFSMDHIQ